MRVVIQRVKQADVKVNGNSVGKISKGCLIFLAVAKDDTEKELTFLVEKVGGLRIFEDEQGKMNLSAADVQGEFLVVSQFTLIGNCQKGRRPSFEGTAEPEKAQRYYKQFVAALKAKGFKVETGQFAEMMEVSLINDGPATFIIDSSS